MSASLIFMAMAFALCSRENNLAGYLLKLRDGESIFSVPKFFYLESKSRVVHQEALRYNKIFRCG